MDTHTLFKGLNPPNEMEVGFIRRQFRMGDARRVGLAAFHRPGIFGDELRRERIIRMNCEGIGIGGAAFNRAIINAPVAIVALDPDSADAAGEIEAPSQVGRD